MNQDSKALYYPPQEVKNLHNAAWPGFSSAQGTELHKPGGCVDKEIKVKIKQTQTKWVMLPQKKSS